METKRKRKSFIDLNRTSRIFLFDDNGSDDPEDAFKGKKNMTVATYLKSLKEEREQWKEILKTRQAELKQAKKSCQYENMQINLKEVEEFLEDEDRAFLKNKPDYLSIMENAKKYMETVSFMKRYKTDVIEYYSDIVDEVGSETDFLLNYLCQKDACDLCNKVNCTDESHKIPVDA